MLVEILNKIAYTLFFISILNIVRTIFFLIGSFIKSDEDQPQKLRLGGPQLFFLGLSIAYILTSIFTGIKII